MQIKLQARRKPGRDWVQARPVIAKSIWPVLIAVVIGAAPFSVAAQVYKWTDENGIVTFSNIAPPADQDFQVLRFPCYAADPKCRSVSWEKVPLNTRAYRAEIRSAAQYNAIEESLIRAIIHAESAYQPDAQSPKGAQGLMQLMPETQAELDVADPFDPEANINGGTRYLSQLLEEFDGDFELAAAAYNAGPNAVYRYGGVPPFDETQEYVRRVKILYRRYGQAL
jgi:soluble lytic murein transglycosylase-like protein